MSPATLADSTEVWTYRLNPDAPDLPSATVRAPCCGRVCAADMVADVRTVGATTRAFACDACRERWARADGWSRSRIKDVRGYPSSEVLLERAKERLQRDRRTMTRAFNPGERLQKHLRDLRASN